VASEGAAPTAARELLARLGKWQAANLLGAGVSTLVELSHVWRYFPAALSDPPGYFLYVAQAYALFLAAGLPAAVLGSLAEPFLSRLVRKATLADLMTIICGVAATVSVLRIFEGIFAQGRVRSFPEHIDRIVLLGQIALLAGMALLAVLAIRPAFSWLARRLPAVDRPRAILTAAAFGTAIVLAAVSSRELFAVHLDHALLAIALASSSLLTSCSWLVLDAVRRRPPNPAILVASLVALALPPLVARDNPHGRFVLYQQSPLAGALASLPDRWRDLDWNGASSAPAGGSGSPRTTADAAALVPLANGCDARPLKPSILLVTVDALRHDAVRPAVMPNLSSFAGRATVFERAYSPAAFTEYSFLSLFAAAPLSDMLVGDPLENTSYCAGGMFPEVLRRAGYRTAYFSRLLLPAAVSRGFGEPNPYLHPLDASEMGEFDEHAPLSSAATTRDAIDFVTHSAGAPFFLWAHYTDTHAPYNVSARMAPTVAAMSPYERDAAYVDHHIGRLLGAVSALDGARNTIIAVTADHGEDLMENGREGHGTSAGDGGVHVPLMIWIPGCPPRKVKTTSALTGLGPALLQLAGLASSRPALALDRRPAQPAVSEAFERRNGARNWVRGISFGDFRLLVDVIHGGRMLFDVRHDPHETIDLYAALPQVSQRMESSYREWLDRPRAFAPGHCTPGVDEDGFAVATFGNAGPGPTRRALP
jgi:arylsulfatase A-like enzyme